MKNSNDSNYSRHVSVLDSNQFDSPPQKIRKVSAWILFISMFFLAVLNDSSVIFLDIPDLSKADLYEGMLGINEPTRKVDRSIFLKIDSRKLKFRCWIRPGRGGNCLQSLNTHELDKLEGKNAKIYSYRALISGFFYENRLLQLEIDNNVIISYKQQKEDYLESKKHYLYLYSVFCFLSLLFLVFVYMRNDT